MTPDVRDQMFAHALAERPNEACGMFSAPTSVDLVDYFHPMQNAAESPMIFQLDGQEMLDLERGLDEAGRVLLGVMHSHTSTSAYPSPTDIADSSRFDPTGMFRHVIVSLRHGEPVLRCFQIKEQVVAELLVVVTDGDDDQQDEGGSVAMAAVMALPRRD